MSRTSFKVLRCEKDSPEIKEVKGYFTWLDELRVFMYYDYKYREWYVIDLDTGMAFAKGESMYRAKVDAIDKKDLLETYRHTDKYLHKKSLYKKMLKEARSCS